jgi:hypothetical protein
VRGGATHYVLRFSLPWVLVKSLKFARMRPWGISGGAFLYGYLRAALTRSPRVEDDEYVAFVRADERRRLRRALPLRRLRELPAK